MSGEKPRARRTVSFSMPRTRLAAMVNRPGGTWRHEAIAEATRRVEALRVPYMEVIDEMIGQLEAAWGRKDRPQDDCLADLTHLADRIITLAGSFGLIFLADAAMRLCDMAQALGQSGLPDRGQIAVHVQAVRLLGPLSPPVSDAAAKTVLAELQRVYRHFEGTATTAGDAATRH